ncbi:Uncharacterized protein SCF082_LOCUS38373 [Durusdinium trenchii]|uniref:Uncharacterized protein n=1 Tax=Durusdinium trenchii TaxID=1381693 RepID=A0ABP0PYL0_9DINO
MAQWRVGRCHSAAELGELVAASDVAQDKTMRYKAAEKLLELHDRTRRTKLAPCKSDFDKFLREQRAKARVDWKDRGLEQQGVGTKTDNDDAERRDDNSSVTLPKIAGLPSFAADAPSASAYIAQKLIKRKGLESLDADAPVSGTTFSNEIAQYKAGKLCNGGFTEEDHVDLAAEKANLERKRRETNAKLLETSRLGATVQDDPALQPGIRFWTHVPAKHLFLEKFMPDTVVVSALSLKEGQATVFLNHKEKHVKGSGSLSSRTARFQVPLRELESDAFRRLLLKPGKTAASRKTQPLFVLKSARGQNCVRLLFTRKDVHDVLRSLATTPQATDAAHCVVLQRYVRPSGKFPWLTRLIFSENGKSQIFTLTSKRRFPVSAGPAPPLDFNQTDLDASALAKWTVPADDQDQFTIVYGGAKKDNKGAFERPCAIAQGLHEDLVKYQGLRMQKLCLEFVRTQTNRWFLVSVRGFLATQSLVLSGPTRNAVPLRQVFLQTTPKNHGDATSTVCSPSTPSDTGTPASESSCFGDYCEMVGLMRKTEAVLRQVPYKFIAFDRMVNDAEGVLSDFDKRHLALSVPVCRACHRFYHPRVQDFWEAAHSVEAADADDACQNDTNEDAHDDVDVQSQGVKKKCRKPVKAPYSAQMLQANSSKYAEMVRKQRLAIRKAKEEEQQNDPEGELKGLTRASELLCRRAGAKQVKMEARLEELCVDPELLQEYRRAKESVVAFGDLDDGDVELDDGDAVEVAARRRRRALMASDMEGEEEEEEKAASQEYALVKKSIQAFLRGRLLVLEKQNHKLTLDSERRKNRIAELEQQLAEEKRQRGVLLVSGFVQKQRTRLLKESFSLLRDDSPETSARGQRLCLDQESKMVAKLRSENRRLRIELEDRSRAAEVLCKRLLRVDASLRSRQAPQFRRQ